MNQNDKTQGMAGTAKEFGDKTSDFASKAAEQVESGLDTVKRKASEAKTAITEGAGATIETVKDTVVEKADAARESLSDVGSRLAETLQRASADTDSDALKSRLMSSVAQGLTSASDALRQRSVSELTEDVRAMARKHPGAFMAAAAVAGFAAARFIRSSARRMDDDRGRGPRV